MSTQRANWAELGLGSSASTDQTGPQRVLGFLPKAGPEGLTPLSPPSGTFSHSRLRNPRASLGPSPQQPRTTGP